MKLHEINDESIKTIRDGMEARYAELLNRSEWTDEEIRQVIVSKLPAIYDVENQLTVVNGEISFAGVSAKGASKALSSIATLVRKFPFTIKSPFKGDLLLVNENTSLMLTSLHGLPEKISGEFLINDAPNLYSLKGLPKAAEYVFDRIPIAQIDISFPAGAEVISFRDCNNLAALSGMTEHLYELNINNCFKINNLKGVPSVTDLRLRGLPRFNSFAGVGNQLKFCERIFLNNMHITDSILGLLEVDGLKQIYFRGGISKDMSHAFDILNRHLDSAGKDIFDCQSELIDAGLDAYAQL